MFVALTSLSRLTSHKTLEMYIHGHLLKSKLSMMYLPSDAESGRIQRDETLTTVILMQTKIEAFNDVPCKTM